MSETASAAPIPQPLCGERLHTSFTPLLCDLERIKCRDDFGVCRIPSLFTLAPRDEGDRATRVLAN